MLVVLECEALVLFWRKQAVSANHHPCVAVGCHEESVLDFHC